MYLFFPHMFVSILIKQKNMFTNMAVLTIELGVPLTLVLTDYGR
jgi:hypothetical protein